MSSPLAQYNAIFERDAELVRPSDRPRTATNSVCRGFVEQTINLYYGVYRVDSLLSPDYWHVPDGVGDIDVWV